MIKSSYIFDFMNVLLLIDTYEKGGGAKNAADLFASEWKKQYGDVCICVNTFSPVNYKAEIDVDVFCYEHETLINVIEKKKIDIINYYRSATPPKTILDKVLCSLHKQNYSIPIVITVCQKPSYNLSILKPSEIKVATSIVFIDKSSYDDPLYKFIPKNRKEVNYLGAPDSLYQCLEDIYLKPKVSHEGFVYGRGSTIQKCPKDMIDVYDKISVENKRFEIYGIVDEDNWLSQICKSRKDICIHGRLGFLEWLLACKNFDVYLYQLPIDGFSSLDATLGHAMLLGIPPIVYGPSAPKERIEHGVNGLIANTKDEIVKYAEMLYYDSELREKIGKKARESMLYRYSSKKTMAIFNDLFCKIINGTVDNTSISVPIYYYIKIYYVYYISRIINKIKSTINAKF